MFLRLRVLCSGSGFAVVAGLRFEPSKSTPGFIVTIGEYVEDGNRQHMNWEMLPLWDRDDRDVLLYSFVHWQELVLYAWFWLHIVVATIYHIAKGLDNLSWKSCCLGARQSLLMDERYYFSDTVSETGKSGPSDILEIERLWILKVCWQPHESSGDWSSSLTRPV